MIYGILKSSNFWAQIRRCLHMSQNKSRSPKGPYYDGHTHFSYNNDLAYHARPYCGSQTFKNMSEKAEQAMADNQIKG